MERQCQINLLYQGLKPSSSSLYHILKAPIHLIFLSSLAFSCLLKLKRKPHAYCQNELWANLTNTSAQTLKAHIIRNNPYKGSNCTLALYSIFKMNVEIEHILQPYQKPGRSLSNHLNKQNTNKGNVMQIVGLRLGGKAPKSEINFKSTKAKHTQIQHPCDRSHQVYNINV